MSMRWGEPLSQKAFARLRASSGVRERSLGDVLEWTRSADGRFGRVEPALDTNDGVIEAIRSQYPQALVAFADPMEEAERAQLGWQRIGTRTYLARGSAYERDFWSLYDVTVGGWQLIGLPDASLATPELAARLEGPDGLVLTASDLGTWGIAAGYDCDDYRLVFSAPWREALVP